MTNRSRNLLAGTVGAVGALVAGLVAAGANPVTAAVDPVHSALSSSVTNGFPGALAYVRDGERDRRFGVGVANLATGERARPHQRLRTAGIDDPVEKWLPGVLPYLDKKDWGHVITPAEVIRRAVAHGPARTPPARIRPRTLPPELTTLGLGLQPFDFPSRRPPPPSTERSAPVLIL